MLELDLYTERDFLDNVSYDLMHEWEIDISNYLNIPLIDLYKGGGGRLSRQILHSFDKGRRILGIDRSRFKVTADKKWHIIFIPNALIYLNYTHMSNLIPIFVDFPDSMTEKVAFATKKLPVFFVTAYDIYKRLKELGSDNVEFIPMGISDFYVNNKVPEKKICVVQFGRRNEKLHDWMMKYHERNLNIEYVYVLNSDFEYYSTARGNIGKYESRKKFCELIDKAKIALVSSPGAEGDSRFGKIDFITPRFYECAAHYCFMLGRYTSNEETELIGLDKICPNVNSQKEFDHYISMYINADSNENLNKYKDFLENNVISKRADVIRTVLERALK